MFTPYPITTFNAVNAIKAVAEIKYVTYDKIRDLDLIAKEFKVHRHCYQQFTHWFISVTASAEKDTALSHSAQVTTYERSDFDKVKEYIKNHIINEGNSIAMKDLHETYGLAVGETGYPCNLGQRLQDYLEDTAVFHFFHPPMKILSNLL